MNIGNSALNKPNVNITQGNKYTILFNHIHINLMFYSPRFDKFKTTLMMFSFEDDVCAVSYIVM